MLATSLPPAQRIALAYAGSGNRRALLGLLALDARCAALLRQAREPMLAQLRLAWWREALDQPSEQWPAGEPLFAILRDWRREAAQLAELVGAWEHLAGTDRLSEADIAGFASGRGGAFAALAGLVGCPRAADAARLAGTRWALADLACHLTDKEERSAALDLAARGERGRIALPSALRPLAVLDGLARRSIAANGAPLLDGRIGALAALRLGMLGR